MIKTVLIASLSITLTLFITLSFTQYQEIKKENTTLKIALLENVDENISNIDLTSPEDSSSSVPENNHALSPSKDPTPKTTTQTRSVDQMSSLHTATSTPSQNLEILNVKVKSEEKSAKIFWSTSIKSESRLLIHKGGNDEIFPSDTVDGISHSVLIGGLSDSLNYTFEIVALVDGKEVSKFDKFFTKRVFTAVHEGRNNKECNVFKIIDSQSNPLVGESVTISSHGRGDSGEINYIWPNRTVTSDTVGNVAYCNLPTIPARAKIIHNSTKEIIFDEMLYY